MGDLSWTWFPNLLCLSVKKEIAVLAPVRKGIRIMFIIHRNEASSHSNLKVFKKVCTYLSGLKLIFCERRRITVKIPTHYEY